MLFVLLYTIGSKSAVEIYYTNFVEEIPLENGSQRGEILLLRHWPFTRGTHRSLVDSPTQRTSEVSFDIVIYVGLDKLVSKQSSYRRFHIHHINTKALEASVLNYNF